MTLSIEKLAHDLGEALKKNNLKIATAESCTGGGLGYWITSVPGSSAWFERGFVTYSDLSKIELLSIDPDTIKTFGAVSETTACAMAEGALLHSHADVSVAITGIAGPTGGSASKPVGTIWFAVAKHHVAPQAHLEIFPGSRQEIRAHAIERALEIVLNGI